MGLKITIDVFSGRPNPTVELDDRQAAGLLERLAPARLLEAGEPDPLPEPTLGYRGVIVEQTGEPVADLPRAFRVIGGDLRGPGLAHKARDEEVEDVLLRPDGPLRDVEVEVGAEADGDFFERLRAEVGRFREVRAHWPPDVHPPPWWPRRCECAPLYEPKWWNTPTRQPDNNCYNYATNYRTDTFAQPGQAAGAMYTDLTCPAVHTAALADALVDAPGADNACPKEGHLVALVVAPGWDFHWYRKGRNGSWSHKPGGTQVTDVDNAGKPISDPRTADRGPYTDFCTFMVVMHGHVKIQ
jgi:hypothetical protein